MRKAIACLEQVGHIRQIHNGRWLFKCVLAAKPHQEHIRDINEFVWCFCVNYQPLNSVTRIIAYPIPRCDSAVFVKFGNGQFLWLFDTPLWITINSQSNSPARRNSHSRDLRLLSGHTPSCLLAQPTDPLHSSV